VCKICNSFVFCFVQLDWLHDMQEIVLFVDWPRLWVLKPLSKRKGKQKKTRSGRGGVGVYRGGRDSVFVCFVRLSMAFFFFHHYIEKSKTFGFRSFAIWRAAEGTNKEKLPNSTHFSLQAAKFMIEIYE